MNIEFTPDEVASLHLALKRRLEQCDQQTDSAFFRGEKTTIQKIMEKVEQAQAREARYDAERQKSWEDVNADNLAELSELHRKCRPFSRWATDADAAGYAREESDYRLQGFGTFCGERQRGGVFGVVFNVT